MTERYRYAICGYGPAGSGVTLAAAKLGEFENMCKDGLCIMDRSDRYGFGKLGEYLITANTPAGYSIAPINPTANDKSVQSADGKGSIMTPMFDKMRSGPVYEALLKKHEENPLLKGTLEQYGLYCEEVGKVMTSEMQGKSKAYLKTALKSMQLLSDGSFKLTASTEGGEDMSVIAETVAIAIGGQPRIPEGAYGKDPCYSADYIQRVKGMGEMRAKATEVIAAGAKSLKVMVVGGSHSAFSATKLLLDSLGHPLEVRMYHRGVIRVFYASEDEAKEAGYKDYRKDQICQTSGQVHRFGGIRSPVRELYADVKAGKEKRLRFVQFSKKDTEGEPSGEFAKGLKWADVLVMAIGYGTNTVPLTGPMGMDLKWCIAPDGQVKMDNFTAQPYVHVGGPNKPATTIPNLYALGLGYGLMAGGAMKIGEPGIRLDGQGQYHTWIGQLVFSGMLKAEVAPVWRNISLENAFIAAYLTVKWRRRVRFARKYQGLLNDAVSAWDVFDKVDGPKDAEGDGEGDEEEISEEKAAWLETFRLFDLDNSGTMEIDEIVKRVKAMNLTVEPSHIKSFFEAADINHSNGVDQAEFLKYVSEKMPRKKVEAAASEVFAVIDKDKSGSISKDELRKVMSDFGLPILDEEADMLLSSLDTNHDGKIEFAEFCVLIGSTAAPVTMKVTSAGGPGRYIRAAKKFLQGGDGQTPVAKLIVKGLGNAIPIVSAVSGQAESEGFGTVTKVSTFYAQVDRSQSAGLEVTLKPKAA